MVALRSDQRAARASCRVRAETSSTMTDGALHHHAPGRGTTDLAACLRSMFFMLAIAIRTNRPDCEMRASTTARPIGSIRVRTAFSSVYNDPRRRRQQRHLGTSASDPRPPALFFAMHDSVIGFDLVVGVETLASRRSAVALGL